MSGSGGVSIARSRGGESRFYNPPPMRKQKQLQQQQQQQQMTTTTMQRREQRSPLISKGSTEKRTDHEDCTTLLPSSSSSSSAANNSSKTNDDNSTNLDRFLEFTTPVVSAQYLPKTSIRGCRGQECGLECPPYFEMVDAIAESEGISINNVNFKALLGRGFIGNVPVMLAKPHTFMNSSGESVNGHRTYKLSLRVGSIVSYYKIPLKYVLVVYDDLDLPFAKLRLLPKGGHGGHNGMRSIIDRLKGSRDFPRLRIGIGRPPGKMDAVNFVLRPFNKQEREELEFTFERGIEAVRILLLEGFDKSATFVNSTKAMEQLG